MTWGLLLLEHTKLRATGPPDPQVQSPCRGGIRASHSTIGDRDARNRPGLPTYSGSINRGRRPAKAQTRTAPAYGPPTPCCSCLLHRPVACSRRRSPPGDTSAKTESVDSSTNATESHRSQPRLPMAPTLPGAATRSTRATPAGRPARPLLASFGEGSISLEKRRATAPQASVGRCGPSSPRPRPWCCSWGSWPPRSSRRRSRRRRPPQARSGSGSMRGSTSGVSE